MIPVLSGCEIREFLLLRCNVAEFSIRLKNENTPPVSGFYILDSIIIPLMIAENRARLLVPVEQGYRRDTSD